MTGLKNGVFKDPNWDYKTFNFDSDVALFDRETQARNATDANLKPFFSHGGKLLQYQGWNDNLIPPQNSVNYYNRVADTLGGASKVNDSYRLFMVPGMAHCRGGDGTDRFDVIGALEQWVEQGKAPDSIVAPATLATRWSARTHFVRIRRSRYTKGLAARMTQRTLLAG